MRAAKKEEERKKCVHNLTIKWLLSIIITLEWQFIVGTCGRHFIINALFRAESSYNEMKTTTFEIFAVEKEEKSRISIIDSITR
jgi:hypothetical protein